MEGEPAADEVSLGAAVAHVLNGGDGRRPVGARREHRHGHGTPPALDQRRQIIEELVVAVRGVRDAVRAP